MRCASAFGAQMEAELRAQLEEAFHAKGVKSDFQLEIHSQALPESGEEGSYLRYIDLCITQL